MEPNNIDETVLQDDRRARAERICASLDLRVAILSSVWHGSTAYHPDEIPTPVDNYYQHVLIARMTLQVFPKLPPDEQDRWLDIGEDLAETPVPLPEDFEE